MDLVLSLQGSSHCCGLSSVPGPGTPTCRGCSQKKEEGKRNFLASGGLLHISLIIHYYGKVSSILKHISVQHTTCFLQKHNCNQSKSWILIFSFELRRGYIIIALSKQMSGSQDFWLQEPFTLNLLRTS